MVKTNIGKCIRVAQEMRDISTSKMARDFGVVRQQVHRWRNAEDMRVHKAEEFANYFDMDRNAFLSLGD
jgi:hypothetical protein